MAERIDGMAMRAAILDETRAEAARLLEKHGRKPGLATILVGDNPASVSYVSLKVKTALALGFHEIQDNQPADVSEAALLETEEFLERVSSSAASRLSIFG